MAEENQEKILFQYVMNYKAYRRFMIGSRVGIAVVVTCGFATLCVLNIVLGIVLSVMSVFIGVISVLVSLGEEKTYTVYNTRIVIKRRGDDKRISVPVSDIVSVKYRRAFYEKSLLTGTVTVVAKTHGRRKKYKLKHIFDAQPAVVYLTNARNGGENQANV